MPVEWIELQNFQTFRKTRIDLDPNSTTIVGPTDEGKSSFIRAFCLAFLNDWDSCYTRFGKDLVVVRVGIDGKVLTRKKGKRVNLYKIGKKKYVAFGQSKVPEPIEKFLNVGPDNFQNQLDAHFWFSDTSGIVSKKLNRIINLEEIDRVIAEVGSEVRKVKSAVVHTEERYYKAKNNLKELDWVPAFHEASVKLSDKRKRYKKIDARASAASLLLEDVRSDRKAIGVLANIVTDAEKLVVKGERAHKLDRRIKKATRLLKEIEEAKELTNMSIPDLGPLIKKREAGDKLQEEIAELDHLIEDILNLQGEILVVEQELDTVVKSLKKTKGRCPTCGRKLTKPLHPLHPKSTSKDELSTPW